MANPSAKYQPEIVAIHLEMRRPLQTRVIFCRRATAALRRRDIVRHSPLLLRDGYYFTGQPIEGRHFRWLLALVMVRDSHFFEKSAQLLLKERKKEKAKTLIRLLLDPCHLVLCTQMTII